MFYWSLEEDVQWLSVGECLVNDRTRHCPAHDDDACDVNSHAHELSDVR